METLKFTRGKSPEKALNIGKRAEIDKWFSEWVPDAKYEVDDVLNITVNGSLDLYNSHITSLPDNLTVGKNLYLNGSSISSLPDNLKVSRNLYIRNTQITSLPDNLKVGEGLDLRNTPITSLPDNIKVNKIIFKDF